jgi:large subunit ribosomal protein L9
MKKQFLNKKVNVLLLSKIYGLGLRFDVKPVSLGYFSNYLLPKKLAVRADEKVSDFINSIKAKEQDKVVKLKELAEKLENQPLYFVRIANKKGSIFNAINFNDIKSYLKENYDLNVTRNDIRMPNRVTGHGKSYIEVTLGFSISVKMVLLIAASQQEARKMYDSKSVDAEKGVEGERK